MGAFSLATGDFLEWDGYWSTFKLAVGSSPHEQNFQSVVSTTSFDIWLPKAQGCAKPTSSDEPSPPSDCAQARGVGNFNGQMSSGYDDSATSKGAIEQLDIGDNPFTIVSRYGSFYDGWDRGRLGTDTIFMSTSTAPSETHNSSGPVAIFGVEDAWFYLPSIGIGAGWRNNSDGTGENSTVSGMAASGAIPSRSWGYTAGAYYAKLTQDDKRLGSLVLGGYDSSRIGGNTAQFKLKNVSANSNNLLVSVSGMTLEYKNKGDNSYGNGSFDAVLDSSLPYLYLPNDTCDWLMQQLNLVYQNDTNLFTVNSTALETNNENVASMSISLQDISSTGNASITIAFPYAAFDVDASWMWGYPNGTAIFPIRRIVGTDAMAVLGMPFFQEAYVSANFDMGEFNISQVAKNPPGTATIIDLPATSSSSSKQKSSAPVGAIVGGAIGGVLLLLSIILIVLWICIWKPRREQKRLESEEALKPKEVETLTIPETPNPERPYQRNRRDTTVSEASEETAVSEMPTRRPSHNRQYSNASELSSDSEVGAGYRRNMVGNLGYIDEMEYKSDAAELHGYRREHYELEGQSDKVSPAIPGSSQPSELEENQRGAPAAPISAVSPALGSATPVPASAVSPASGSAVSPTTSEMHWKAPFARKDQDKGPLE